MARGHAAAVGHKGHEVGAGGERGSSGKPTFVEDAVDGRAWTCYSIPSDRRRASCRAVFEDESQAERFRPVLCPAS